MTLQLPLFPDTVRFPIPIADATTWQQMRVALVALIHAYPAIFAKYPQDIADRATLALEAANAVTRAAKEAA